MKNHQKCKPCCGGHHRRCCEDVEVIVHPTVHCHEPLRHHHKCVRHIVPVVHHQHHHHHKHHEFEVKRKHCQHHEHHEHGKIERDFCKIDRCECSKGHHGHDQKHGHDHKNGHGEGQSERIEKIEFGSEFDNELFM